MDILKQESLNGLRRMQTSLKRQETNQPPPVKTAYGTTSNPPTLLEIEAVFDTAVNVGVDFVGMIVDTGNGWQHLVWTDGLNWYTIQMNLAI